MLSCIAFSLHIQSSPGSQTCEQTQEQGGLVSCWVIQRTPILTSNWVLFSLVNTLVRVGEAVVLSDFRGNNIVLFAMKNAAHLELLRLLWILSSFVLKHHDEICWQVYGCAQVYVHVCGDLWSVALIKWYTAITQTSGLTQVYHMRQLMWKCLSSRSKQD